MAEKGRAAKRALALSERAPEKGCSGGSPGFVLAVGRPILLGVGQQSDDRPMKVIPKTIPVRAASVDEWMSGEVMVRDSGGRGSP